MAMLITRFETEDGHGWYIGSDAEVVLAPGENEVWPGMFEAFCRLRGWTFDDLRFRSEDNLSEFLSDLRGEVASSEDDAGAGRATG